MDEKKRNVPKIRFPGFTDEWEQRKLGELCNITTGKLDANAMVSDGQYDFYTSGIDVFKIDVAAFEGPAITIAGNGASVGYMHLADGKFNAYQRTYVLTDFLADRQFLNVAIGNELPDRIQEEVRGSGIPYIVLNMLTDLAIPFPSHEEQYAIGVYFQQLDKLITLHQRKLDHLKELKKGLLQKMFPKNGASVPEIRFPRFTDAWEQRKLGELAEFSKGQGYTKSDLRESGIPIILYGRLYTKYQPIIREVDTFADATPQAVFSKGGEVILPSSGETAEDIAIAASVDKSGFLLGGGLNIVLPHKEIDSAFLAIEISFGTPHTELAKRAQGKSVVHLYNEDLKAVEISYPTIAEQKQISTLFDSFDNLITLHQRKLDHLKELKKGLLQQMFV
ncbi:MAG: restriction endonuclease subunit S [Ruminococcaceae bacterium]|nr:restriction endonuclease subunit S [Oscillospiraceae bacterium]